MKEEESRRTAEETEEKERPSPTLGMELSFTAKHLHESLRKAGEIAGMPDGYRTLHFPLAHEDGLTQLELAKSAHLSPPTVSVTRLTREIPFSAAMSDTVFITCLTIPNSCIFF